jgi:hypothetical protein
VTTGSESLTPAEAARLDAFAARFDRLSASEYYMFAAEGASPERVREAMATASETLGSGSRRRAVSAAVSRFADSATRAYSRRISLPDTILLYQSLPDRPEDRVRFLASLERAVVAIILGDRLDEEDRSVLLGPWAELVETPG